jgi:hypothetical protein
MHFLLKVIRGKAPNMGRVPNMGNKNISDKEVLQAVGGVWYF